MLLFVLWFDYQRYRRSVFEKQVETNAVPSLGGAACSLEAQEIDLKLTKEVFLSLVFAGIATVFVVGMILLVPSPTTRISMNERIIVSGVFIGSCCVGINLALYPGWFRKITRREIHTANNINELSKRSFYGHHPDCERFQTHRITMNNKTWCAGCLGLLIGSILSILFMVMYMGTSIVQSRSTFFMLFLLGLAVVVFTFIETMSKSKHAVTHLFFNVMLVPSFFVITISITELTGKSIFGVFTVPLCALWLDTRVTLSTWRHRRTCSSCPESCKMYALSTS